jgi:hypothetical protein
MKQAARATALSLLAAVLTVTASWATTAVERSETDLIQEASVIVTGRCTHLQSQWLDRTLVTIAKISVSEVLKGEAGSEVTVVLPGGIDSNRPVPVAMTFPGAPEIRQGEQVLLFLTPEGRLADGLAVVGFSQGKYTLAETAGGEKVATQDLSGLNLQTGEGTVRRGNAKAIDLRQLRRAIRETPAAGRQQ